jgi:hypothetical protein
MSKQRILPSTKTVGPPDSTREETPDSLTSPQFALRRFLLQDDPEAPISVEVVDQIVELPQEQFKSLLVDSECEV